MTGNVAIKDSLVFTLISLVPLMLIFLLATPIRDSIIGLFFGSYAQTQVTPTQLLSIILVNGIIYELWMIILLLTISIITNTILAKVFNLQTGRVMIVTILALAIGFFSYHLVMYIYFYTGDPFSVKNVNSIEILIEKLLTKYEASGQLSSALDSSTLSGFLSLIGDILGSFIYWNNFIIHPTFGNYFTIYIVSKSFGSLYAPFNYDFLGMFFIYVFVFIFLFNALVNSCACTSPSKYGNKRMRRLLGEYIPNPNEENESEDII